LENPISWFDPIYRMKRKRSFELSQGAYIIPIKAD